MKEISLTKGKVALVDDADFPALSRYNWHTVAAPDGETYYAARNEKGEEDPTAPHKRARRRTIYMQRHIVNAPDGVKVKFLNGDTLDCRRENLSVDGNSSYRKRSSEESQIFEEVPGHPGIFLYKGESFLRGKYCWKVAGGGYMGGASSVAQALARRDGTRPGISPVAPPTDAANTAFVQERGLKELGLSAEAAEAMTTEEDEDENTVSPVSPIPPVDEDPRGEEGRDEEGSGPGGLW